MTRLLTKDLGWKLFSLFLALAIWLTVHQIDDESANPAVASLSSTFTFENLPVLIVSTASDVHDFRVAPTTVDVTVSGPPDIMTTLRTNQIRPVVDLTDIAGAKDLTRQVDVSTPAGITLVAVDPPKVGVILPPRR